MTEDKKGFSKREGAFVALVFGGILLFLSVIGPYWLG